MSLPPMQSVCTKPKIYIEVNMPLNFTRLSFAICYLTITLKANTTIFRYILYLFFRRHIFQVQCVRMSPWAYVCVHVFVFVVDIKLAS